MAEYSSKYRTVALLLLLLLALVITSEHVASGDVDKDREKCGNQLVGVATCLPYVSGDATSPAPDCCTGLGTLLRTSPQCLCLLIKDRNDPSLGLSINATRAITLPSYCHAPANISACPSLLHLAPNSPDAKVFEDFANTRNNGSHAANTTTHSPVAANSSSENARTATSAGESNSGGGGKMKKRWIGGTETVIGISLILNIII